jgi:hypothetical protein
MLISSRRGTYAWFTGIAPFKWYCLRKKYGLVISATYVNTWKSRTDYRLFIEVTGVSWLDFVAEFNRNSLPKRHVLANSATYESSIQELRS